MSINIPSQYDIVSMAKRVHIGFYAKCKNVMKCICAAYEDSRKKHFEPPHDKTNNMTFVPSEDSDQPGQFCFRWTALQADSADSDQTGRMPRLI